MREPQPRRRPGLALKYLWAGQAFPRRLGLGQLSG
jgi:hypothetical protein